MKKSGVIIFGYGLLSLIFLALIYLIIISEGTMNIKWSEFTQKDVYTLYVFIAIYTIGFIIFLFYNPSQNIEKRDLKKLDMKKPISVEQYIKLLEEDNKYLFLRTAVIGTHTQRHYISDKMGNIYYKIILTSNRPDVFTILDPFDNELGKLKTSVFDAFNIKNTLIINDKEVFKFEKYIKDLKADYKIESLNWDIEENKDNHEFVIKSKKTTIGSIEPFELGNIADYDIVVEDKNRKLELSCLALCLILSDEQYRRIKD